VAWSLCGTAGHSCDQHLDGCLGHELGMEIQRRDSPIAFASLRAVIP
jgi:hypothetical protein